MKDHLSVFIFCQYNIVKTIFPSKNELKTAENGFFLKKKRFLI